MLVGLSEVRAMQGAVRHARSMARRSYGAAVLVPCCTLFLVPVEYYGATQ